MLRRVLMFVMPALFVAACGVGSQEQGGSASPPGSGTPSAATPVTLSPPTPTATPVLPGRSATPVLADGEVARDLARRVPLRLEGMSEIDGFVSSGMEATIYQFQLEGSGGSSCRTASRMANSALDALGRRGFKRPVASAQYGDGSRRLGDTYVRAFHWPGSGAAIRRWAAAYSAWQVCGFGLTSQVLRADTFSTAGFTVHRAIARGASTEQSLVFLNAVRDSVTIDLRCFYTTDNRRCQRVLQSLVRRFH